MDYVIYHNSVTNWGITLGLFLLYAGCLSLLKRMLVGKLRVFTEAKGTHWNDAVATLLERTKLSTILLLSFFAASQFVNLPARPSAFVDKLAFFTLLYQITLWGDALIGFLVNQYARASAGAGLDGARTTSMRAIGFLCRLVFFALIVLWGLDNLGINITTLVTGLGVGGVAIALAVQNILGDLFASVTILLDRPFVIGDSIVAGEFAGTIEHIGLKTTRLRSQTGEELIFPNAGLLQSRIRNYKRMRERRALFSVGVTYQTTVEQLRAIPGILKQTIEAQGQTRFERAHFTAFGDSELKFEVVYWMLDPGYNLYMDTQQTINLAIYEEFEKRGIEFAYPTQMLYVQPSQRAFPIRAEYGAFGGQPSLTEQSEPA